MFQMYSKVIFIYMYIIYIVNIFHILFHQSLLQEIEYTSMCSTVGPCWCPILYTVLHIC